MMEVSEVNKPTRTEDAVLITVPTAMRQVNMSRANVMKLAAEAKAIVRFNRMVRINADRFYSYIIKEYGC